VRKKRWLEVPPNGPGHIQPNPMLDRLAERIAKAARPEQATAQRTAKRRKWFEHPIGRQG